MAISFSAEELGAIGEVQRKLDTHRRGWIALGELVPAVLHEIARGDVLRITPHCLAMLPAEARPHVETCLDRIAASDGQSDLVLVIGRGPSEKQRARVRSRYPALAREVAEYYRRFGDLDETPAELAVPRVDHFWETLRGLRAQGGPICKGDGCGEPAVRVSVFCAKHHYERIVGKPPPDY